jgi:hypothetical protein
MGTSNPKKINTPVPAKVIFFDEAEYSPPAASSSQRVEAQLEPTLASPSIPASLSVLPPLWLIRNANIGWIAKIQ